MITSRQRLPAYAPPVASFYYSATLDESLTILRDLCARGFVLIADDTYDEPAAPQYTEVNDELMERLRRGPVFFLTGAFTRFPVAFKRLGGGPAEGRYVVDIFTQGPVLQGAVARINVVEGIPTALPGGVTCRSTFRNPETGEREKVSDEARAAYRRAVS